ncbi:RHS domain-containing protein, partial [Methylobacterium sp. Leaf100]|uniref:RHS domain-containing protein n=1 Tax=Methylobacterium sp. Leaf100 TaxID=1736252 RepID=UPI001AEC6589
MERTYAWARDFSPRAIADTRWGETTYETDAAGQVVRTRHGDGSEERFAYDAALNLAESGTAEDRLRPWQVAPGGRVERARGPFGETILLNYDARLRVVERRVERAGFRPRVWRYAWDAHDRLVSCETPSGEDWVYGYDPFGRRVSKRRVLAEAEEAWVRGRFPGLVQSVAAGGRSGLDVWAARPAGASDLDGRPPVVGIAYLWDGDVVAEEAPLRLDGGIDWGDATRWHYEPGGFVPVAKETPEGSLHYIVTDHLGTPREVFGEAGDLVWAAEYRTWGAVRRLWLAQADNDNAAQWGGTIPPGGRGGGGRTFGALALKDDPEAIAAAQVCPIRFQGQWEDFETGLSYNRFRHYDGL